MPPETRDSLDWVPPPPEPIKGRGAAENPVSRFERLAYQEDPEVREAERIAALESGRAQAPKTVYLRDPSRSALTRNNSPDIGFATSLNPYRGCEHGCVYCYARPTHEYLGFSAGLDFETRILVKDRAPELLRRELSAKSWQPQVVALSGVTDPYQPVERRTRLTRRCLEVFAEFRNPVGIVTKNALVARDADVLGELAAHRAALVNISVTSLDGRLHRLLEPRSATPAQRLRAIEALARARVPVGVMVAPIVPGLTDHEIPRILQAARDAGAEFAGHIVLRLPHGVKELFAAWLERHFPFKKDKVLGRVREVRGGRLNDPRFGSRLRGEGLYAEQIHAMFDLASRRAGYSDAAPPLSVEAFRRPADAQLGLFG